MENTTLAFFPRRANRPTKQLRRRKISRDTETEDFIYVIYAESRRGVSLARGLREEERTAPRTEKSAKKLLDSALTQDDLVRLNIMQFISTEIYGRISQRRDNER